MTAMTSRERLLTALRRDKPDRVPTPLRMWKFLRKYYSHLSSDVDRQLAARDELGLDLFIYGPGSIKPCFSPVTEPWRDDISVEARKEVREDRRIWERTIGTPAGTLHDIKQARIIKEGSGGGPEIIEPLIKNPARDIDRYRYMHADPRTIDVQAGLELTERVGEKGLVVGNMYSPIDCRDAMRPDQFMMLYHDDRDAFTEIVRIGADAMMEETKIVLGAGFDVIKTWWFYCSPSYGWSPEIYENVFLPHLEKHVELVHSYDASYIYYDDGKMRDFVDFYVGAGIDCLMTCTPPPMGNVDPKWLKETYGDRVCIMGGFDAVNEVYLSTPEAIRSTVKERLEIFKPGGAYIMDGSNSLVYETPVENVRAFADAAHELGTYD